MKVFFRSALVFAVIGAGFALSWRAFKQRSDAKLLATQTTPVIARERAMASALSTPSVAPGILPQDPPPGSGSRAALESVDSLLAQIGLLMNSSDEQSWNRLLNELFPALLQRDRAAAVRVVEGMPVGEKREALLRRLARAWAAVDFEGAVGWLGSLARSEDQKPGFEEACLGAMENNPAEAVRVWEKCAFTADDHVMANLTQNWAAKDLEAAKTWVTARPTSMQRDQAVERIAYVMAQSKPAEAAAFAVQEIPPGPAQTEAVIAVLHQWAEKDSAGATAWAAHFSDPTLRDRAINEFVGR